MNLGGQKRELLIADITKNNEFVTELQMLMDEYDLTMNEYTWIFLSEIHNMQHEAEEEEN